jgi:hypothetical protein
MKIRDNSGLTIDNELRKEFPAVFADRPSSRVSENYQMYRSDEIIEQMLEKGMRLVEIAQQRARSRNPSTQLHTLRFQPKEAPAIFGINDSVPEVVVMNGHDGRNKFRALAGVFRFICSNGMVVADQELGAVIRRHFGENNTFAKVQTILNELPETVNLMSGRILDWSTLMLDEKQQTSLAAKLIRARGTPDWVEPVQVLEARRETEEKDADGKRNLWTTFNVLQENLTNSTIENGAEGRHGRMRPITGAWGSVKANESLWATADKFFNRRKEEIGDDEFARLRKNMAERVRRLAKKEVEPA